MKRPAPTVLLAHIFALVLLLSAAARAEVREVYLTPHFHYDPVFVEDQNTYTDVGFDRCRRFLDALKLDPDYHVVFSEIDYLKPYFDAFPEERATLLKFIADNRIETGGSYSEPNEMSVGGEGIIRNILYGKAYHEGVLGDRNARVYMPFDVFGHTLQLPQILAKSRFDGCIWRKGNPPIPPVNDISVPGLPPDFMALAPDGSTLLNRREHYKSVANTESIATLAAKVDKKKQLQDKLGLHADFGLLSSDDFAYPEPWLAGNCAALKKLNPPIIISGPSAYFDAIKKQLKEENFKLPEITRDFSLYHAGTALTHVDLKIANRLGENSVLTAEKFSTVASLLGAPYPEAALDKSWRLLIFGQHHDAITGTMNDRSYFDLMAGYREALELSTSSNRVALEKLESKINTNCKYKDAIPIIVFNPLGWKRTDVVTTPYVRISDNDKTAIIDSEGGIIRFSNVGSRRTPILRFTAENVPPLGYETYYIINNEAKRDFMPAELDLKTVIENEYYIVAVDSNRGGAITRLFDKQTGLELISPDTKFPGNELIVLSEDKGPQYPAWELSTTRAKDRSSVHPANVTRPDSMTIHVEGNQFQPGKYEQEIRLYKGVKRIDFMTTIIKPATSSDINDRNLWLVRFPAKLNGTAPLVEDRFFATARRRSLEPLSYRTDLEKMLTFSAPYSANNWVEEGNAVRVDIHDNKNMIIDAISLQLCEIVHSHKSDSIAAAEMLQRALITRGVTCTPSFDDDNHNTDLLNRNFRFVLDIGGDNSYSNELLGNKKQSETFKSKLKKNGTSRMLISARTNDIKIRSVDTLLISATNSRNMKKQISKIADTITKDKRINLQDFEDARGLKKEKMHRPDDYGIALINRGTLLHSFDDNGTIVMGLFHSAQWSKEQMGTPFAFPETKDHRFIYSLYPHAGDWRDADTWKVAQEANTPLILVATKQHGGDLPSKLSFFNIESQSTALSAIKAAGNQYAFMKTAANPGPSNGVIMRFYEAEGQPDTVKVKFFKPVKNVWRTNLIEEKIDGARIPVKNKNTIEFKIGPNAIETILVEFADVPDAPMEPAQANESGNMIYSNYWDLNLGAAYMENSPVSVTLGFPLDKRLPDPKMTGLGVEKPKEKKFKKGENTLRLTVSNNSADERLTGDITIETPGSWTAEPSAMKIDLAPMEAKVIDLKVNADRPVDAGFVRALLKTGEQTWFAAMPVAKQPELDVEAKFEHTKLRQPCGPGNLMLHIRNNQGTRMDGSVFPVSPIESWPSSMAGDYSLFSISRGSSDNSQFSLDPGREYNLEFMICNSGLPMRDLFSWYMFKITFNGNVKYVPITVDTH